jgi:hypothetical protein
MKDYDSRIYWIVGEGIPSIKEKREQRHTQVGFNIVKPQERVDLYRVCCTVLEVMYAGFGGDRCVYRYGSYIRAYFFRFVCNCISLSGILSFL